MTGAAPRTRHITERDGSGEDQDWVTGNRPAATRVARDPASGLPAAHAARCFGPQKVRISSVDRTTDRLQGEEQTTKLIVKFD